MWDYLKFQKRQTVVSHVPQLAPARMEKSHFHRAIHVSLTYTYMSKEILSINFCIGGWLAMYQYSWQK